MEPLRKILMSSCFFCFSKAHCSAPAIPIGENSTSGTLAVSAAILNSCASISSGGLAFGTRFAPLSKTDATASGSINLTCTNGTSYTVALDDGEGADASYTNRIMTETKSTLSYNIYTNNTYTDVFGDGENNSSTVSGTGNGSTQSIAMYGKIPALQDTAVIGDYTDTITVTVLY